MKGRMKKRAHPDSIKKESHKKIVDIDKLKKDVAKLKERRKSIGSGKASSIPDSAKIRLKEKIEEKREKALLGGGHKRIDAQHKRVGFIVL